MNSLQSTDRPLQFLFLSSLACFNLGNNSFAAFVPKNFPPKWAVDPAIRSWHLSVAQNVFAGWFEENVLSILVWITNACHFLRRRLHVHWFHLLLCFCSSQLLLPLFTAKYPHKKPVSGHSFYVFCSVVLLCGFFALSELLHIFLCRFTSVRLLSIWFASHLSSDKDLWAPWFGFAILCMSVSLNKSGEVLSSFFSCTCFW